MTMPLNVMIVDDSLIMVQKLSLLLRGLGHEVVRVCNNGTEAIQAYPICKPDLVTMDITMPGDGRHHRHDRDFGESPHARTSHHGHFTWAGSYGGSRP